MTNQKGFMQIFIGIFALLIGGAFMLAKYYGYQQYGIGNPNMTPKIAPGQEWVFRSNNKDFKRGDVIVFKIPQNVQYSNLGRIVGLPGEKILVKDEKILVNDKQLDEPYIVSDTQTENGKALPEGKEKVIPAGNYAVFADNRPKGIDSRDYGFIPKENILGKLVFCYKNCSKSDDTITASFNPQLQANEILNLINQYRQSKNLPSWTTSDQLCKLTEKRADHLSKNHNEAIFAAQSDNKTYQTNFEKQVADYPAAYINEINAINSYKNQDALDIWKESPAYNDILLVKDFSGTSIVNACIAIRAARSDSLVVLLIASGVSAQAPGSTTQVNTQPQSQPVQSNSLGYIRQDIDNLVNDLNLADQDYKDIQTYKGLSNYNQQTVNRINELILQRKALAQKLLDKMGKNQPLTQTDFTTWDQYDALSLEQNNLVKTLHNNGGF